MYPVRFKLGGILNGQGLSPTAAGCTLASVDRTGTMNYERSESTRQ